MIFSYSRLKLYETCPRRFYYKYVLGIPENTSTSFLALGKAVHKAIESIIKGISFEEAIIEGYSECDFHPDVSIEEISKLVKNASATKNMGETEIYFRLPLSNSPNAPEIQGYIDLVKGNRLEDWKTNWKMYDVNDNHQIGLYAWALHQLKGYDLIEGSLSFLRYKKESKYFFSEVDMENAKQWALNLANEINFKLQMLDIFPEKLDELFPDIPSSSCEYCPFVLRCYKDNVREEDINGSRNTSSC
ncbi:PD-(D/E)XK nuclease family protein [Ornithinibacillus contaminans]|uniref:PD-(D/E)XK nuclease family protein n=1 Tax=Ornithinibacillus contaminans TaxID=694055 RepID=UPI00064DC08E|nr:PD-(D/E)XK nuclease family protein [Ornithinibacillus contaminans]